MYQIPFQEMAIIERKKHLEGNVMTAQKFLLLAFSFYYWLLVSVIKLLSLCSTEKQKNTYIIQRLG